MENSLENKILSQALNYAEKLGWSIIPVGKNKRPLIEWKQFQNKRATKEQISDWFNKNPDAGIAVITGNISNIVIVDIDPRHGGSNENFKDIQTLIAKTGGGGWHYYFQYEEGIQNHAGLEPGIDVRGEGGYAVLPPSPHESGINYKWEISPSDDVSISKIPQFVKDLLSTSKTKTKKSKFDKAVLSGVGEGKRNESAASVAGKLLKRFPEEEWENEAWPHLINWNSQNNPPLSEEELRTTFESIKQRQSASSGDDEEGKKPTIALQLVEEINKEKIIFFHTPQKDGFAAINGDGSVIIKLRSRAFKQFISHHIYKNFKKTVSAETISNIIQLLEGKAVFDGEEHDLDVRIAEHGDAIWYDLGNGCVVHIDKSGWRISATPPILFKRFSHQTVQVNPISGGSINDLYNFVNLQSEDDKLLFLVYTIASFIPNFSHPLLVLYGPQGAGKTTPLRLLKSLVDPSILKTLTAPDAGREFVQLASHHYFLFLDNLSSIPNWLSDALARACTGDGFTKRELFSDDDDIIYSFQRTIVLNGINLVVQKADLLDRSILLGLERISKDKRREEQEFWKEFDKLKPGILGAIFDCVTLALIEYPNISLDSHPRMADFARWGCAIARSLGFEDEEFLAAYYRNINSQNDAAIEASPVGTAILTLMDDRDEWEGTATDLLNELERIAEKIKINIKSRDWPKDPSWLTRKIQLIHSNLAEQGLQVTRVENSRPRKILIQKIKENAVATVDGDGATQIDTKSPTPSMSPTSQNDVIADEQTSSIRGSQTEGTPPTLFSQDSGEEAQDEFPY